MRKNIAIPGGLEKKSHNSRQTDASIPSNYKKETYLKKDENTTVETSSRPKV